MKYFKAATVNPQVPFACFICHLNLISFSEVSLPMPHPPSRPYRQAHPVPRPSLLMVALTPHPKNFLQWMEIIIESTTGQNP